MRGTVSHRSASAGASANVMADFYSILKQSILERGLSSFAERDEVYSQARQAMVQRLWSYDPPLAETEIDARIGQFDTAVDRIESELVTAFAEMETAPELEPEPEPEPARPARQILSRARERPARSPLPERNRPDPPPVVEGYDEDADYAAAVAGEPEPSRPAERDRPRLRGTAPALPQLADEVEPRPLRRAAPIEDRRPANRDDRGFEDERSQRGAARFTESEAAADEELYEDEFVEEPPYDTRGGRDDYDEDVEEEEAPRRRRRRTGGSLSEKTLLRLLIAVVTLLAIILIGFATYLIYPFLTASQASSPPAPIATTDATPPAVTRVVSDPKTADEIPKRQVAVAQSFTVFDGSDPTVFQGTSDNPVVFDKDALGGFARIASSTDAAGAKAVIGPGLAHELAGHDIRVTVIARSARERGAVNLRFAYQTGLAISQWQPATLRSDYSAIGLVWRVPTLRANATGDLIVIEPGIPGDGTAVEIKSIKIDVLAS
jgi:hypothetical protein